MPERPGSARAHRLAGALSAATFVLILAGGLVTNTGAALAVPDWPTTFGYNMLLFPWAGMVGGILYEHSHRLLGAAVGLLTAALAVTLWATEDRRWLRRLGVVAVIAVSLQGVLGGLRVVLRAEAVALVHGALAQAFFGLTVCLALVTSRSWVAATPVPSPDALRLRRLARLTAAVVYLQIVLGAVLTHSGVPVVGGHLAGAAVLALLVPTLAWSVMRGHADRPSLVRPARALLGLLPVQLFLGLGAYAARFTGVELPLAAYSGLAFPVAHRLTGGLLLAASLLLTLRSHRALAAPAGSEVAGTLLSREVVA